MISTSDVPRVTGCTVLDVDGATIGKAREVYLDDATGEPEWVTVRTGLFGTSESFVPLSQAELSDDTLRVPYAAGTVTDAPHLGGSGHLSPQAEDELYRHYGLTVRSRADGERVDPDRGTSTGDLPAGDPGAGDLGAGTGTTAGGHMSGATDDAMTRSEERLRVGTEQHVTGRARLRKYVVTETVTVEVPVRREEVRLVHEPAEGTAGAGGLAADAGEPYDGPPVELPEGEHVLVLHEERPVVTTETVPVERVRLATDTVTETRAVSGEVRTEHVELEGDELEGDEAAGRPTRGT